MSQHMLTNAKHLRSIVCHLLMLCMLPTTCLQIEDLVQVPERRHAPTVPLQTEQQRTIQQAAAAARLTAFKSSYLAGEAVLV